MQNLYQEIFYFVQFVFFVGGKDARNFSAGQKWVYVVEEELVAEHLGAVDVEDGVLPQRAGIPDQLAQVITPSALRVI